MKIKGEDVNFIILLLCMMAFTIAIHLHIDNKSEETQTIMEEQTQTIMEELHRVEVK